MHRTTAALVAALAWGCVPAAPGKSSTSTIPSTNDTTPACDDPAYGDGVCQADLACGPPDIDCFRLFPEQAEADAFYTAWEEARASAEVRDPHPVVPSTDPRWGELRDMLDEGWASYLSVFEMGDLAQETPALVLVDDPNPNAFVISDAEADLSAFLVMFTTGMVALGADDDAMLALMLHELEHAVGLHLIGGTSDRMRRFYVADGDEPIGADQPDDPAARPYAEAWLQLAAEAGPFPDPEVGGLPYLGGGVYQLFVQALSQRLDADPDRCIPATGPYAEVVGEIVGYADPVAVTLDVPRSAGVPDQVEDALASLRDGCWPDAPNDFATVLGGVLGMSADQVRDALPPEQVAIVDGLHFVDGVAALLAAEREQMRELELAFPDDNAGIPWSGLRYFSFEEAADDVTVPVMAALGRRVEGQADMLLALLPGEHQDVCLDLLDQGVPPYGDDLTDEHHATCWRVDHVRRLAAGDPGPVARVRTEPWAGVGGPRVPVPLTLPPTLRLPEPPPAADAPRLCRQVIPGIRTPCDLFPPMASAPATR
jgi:hypothetical protein